MEAIMRTDTSVTSAHKLIASDRVQGALVRGAGGIRIGTIERVMIEKLSGNVAYALLRIDGKTDTNRKYLPISWPKLSYDRKLGAYQLDVLEEQVGAPLCVADADFDRSQLGRENGAGDHRGAKSYWGIGENW
jgi:hypothetical protein